MRWVSEVNRIVKDKWRGTGAWWKALLVIGLIVLGCIGIVVLVLWVCGRIIKGLTVGGVKNLDLYYPRVSRRR